MPLPEPYQEHVLNAPDTCNNCFRLVREERYDYIPDRAHNGPLTDDNRRASRQGDGKNFVEISHYGASRETTTEAYDPLLPTTNSRDYFCECGATSVYDRHWEDHEVDRDRFREFIKAIARTLDSKRVSIRTKRFISYALARFGDRHPVPEVGPPAPDQPTTVDEALAVALDQAIAATVATATARAD